MCTDKVAVFSAERLGRGLARLRGLRGGWGLPVCPSSTEGLNGLNPAFRQPDLIFDSVSALEREIRMLTIQVALDMHPSSNLATLLVRDAIACFKGRNMPASSGWVMCEL